MSPHTPTAATASPTCLKIIPYSEDPLRHLAQQVIQQKAERLPNLTDTIVLLPTPQASHRFRRLLLEQAETQGHSALLGPTVDTLPRWISQQTASERPVLSEQQRELMLVEAIINHKYLYGEGNPWTLADSLLELFDDLGATHISLPDSLEGFLDTLGSAYGLARDNDSLFGEARLVHTLWQAWHQQMHENNVIDRHTDYLFKLAASQATPPEGCSIFIAGLTQITTAEGQWLTSLLQQQQAFLLLQGSAPHSSDTEGTAYHPDAIPQKILRSLNLPADYPSTKQPRTCCLDSIFSLDETPLAIRAQRLASDFPQSPFNREDEAASLSIYEASSAEKEAQAIDLQVRLWTAEGKQSIGIVTENRRLARRVRALLERSGIELQDAAGWALSTTSAAATVERWLETIEEDFAHQPLLDFLKSPLLLPEHDRDELLSCVYRFEQGVVLKENIARGLSRYRQHLQFRQKRLPADLAANYDDIHLLLDIIESAAAPLLALVDGKKHAPRQYLLALDESFEQLGLAKSLAEDAAGQRILEELQAMHAATDNTHLQMRWDEFRAWLGRTLERFNFQPPAHPGHVQLMGLAQSALTRFDALIIAGAEAEYLPGSLSFSPFFNDGVRQALGLASYTQQFAEKFHQFRRLLEAADTLLLTRRSEQDGEEIVASPWLERLQSFHRIAYADNLINQRLLALVNQADMQVVHSAEPLPQPMPANPAVSIGAGLFPEHLSASGYQQLINCPYQFFAARCLKLEPPETIKEMLEKADYGERVHLILQAFHQDVRDLPGPFAELISDDNKAAAIQCLHEISTAVFSRDLEDNFLHRGWLKRWQDMIPGYIDWQQRHQTEWRVRSTELNVTTPREHSAITLRGRLDRVDANIRTATRDQPGQNTIDIIDYKTGAIPKEADVLSGESVQLPFYALLAEHACDATVGCVEYLALDNKGETKRGGQKPKVCTVGTLSDEMLEQLTDEVGKRLDRLVQQIQSGTPMPAWGDNITCKHCQMSGICRRETWQMP